MADKDQIDVAQPEISQSAAVSEALQSDVAQVQPASVGTMLQAARTARKLSLQDVSNKLRYSVKQIDALEHDAFEKLPDAMITRGFIRSYAKLLELDAAPLVELYRVAGPSAFADTLNFHSSMQPVALTKDSSPWLKYVLVTILLLLFLLAWIFYVDYFSKQKAIEIGGTPTQSAVEHEVNADDATTAVTTEIQLPEIALPAAERQASDLSAEPAAEPGVIALDGANTATVIPNQAINQNASVVSQNATGLNARKLSFAFTQETWIRVTGKAGDVLFEKTFYAGDSQALSFPPPMTVVVGNAKGAELMVDGQRVDLNLQTKNNVARVVLE
ncbi:MAG: DUF4115 domain-containing protein [Betaproteobacteria bacterium HGW-Betaproteobacteria-22]|nr:MAG: DUF4115 domain-containing protein [Betaproteobacteria bacterium HGW-Betaproteobacteria-22]